MENNDQTKEQGTVKWFASDKGYGFIAPDKGGDDVFVHVNNLVGVNTLKEGDRVEFVIGEGRKGPQANEVTLVASAE